MAPTAVFLAQSESKKRFFDRLGLDERNRLHRHLYSNMKAEAVEGWSRISANRKALVPQLRDDPDIEPPYTFGQIDEEAVREEVMYIYQHARKDTKIMYQLGRDREGDVEQNWIIRWLLWHVFRYRDDRNVGAARRRAPADSEERDLSSDTTAYAMSETSPNADVSQVGRSHRTGSICQAVYTPLSQGTPYSSRADKTMTVGQVATSRYFDPVRDSFRT